MRNTIGSTYYEVTLRVREFSTRNIGMLHGARTYGLL